MKSLSVLFALLVLASCGGSGGTPATSDKKAEVVQSQKTESYVDQLKSLEKTIISRLLEAQDLYVSTDVDLSQEEKLAVLQIFQQDQYDLKLVEEELKRAIEQEKISEMTSVEVLETFADRAEEIIFVEDSSIDLVELHQNILKLDPVVDELVSTQAITKLTQDKQLKEKLTVYQSGLFIYLQ